jgi:hypothetical protein
MKTDTQKNVQFYNSGSRGYLPFYFIFSLNLNNFAASYTKN